ncbi:Spore coat protein A [Glycine soja]|nr:Spore coat protein A [Glycine soja]
MGKRTLLLKLLTLVSLLGCSSASDHLVNVSKLEMFVDELPHMPRILGYHLSDGVPRSKSFKIGMFKKKWKFHKDLPPTTVYAFGTSKHTATVPGPTIEALYGVDTHVRWQNHLPPKHILPWDPTIPTAMTNSTRGIPTVVHCTIANDAKYPYPSGDPVNEANGKVIKFIIIPDHDQQLHTSRLPKRFLEYPLLDLSSVTHTRYVAMYEYASDIDEPTHLYLNAKPYEAPATENPKVGSTELWYVINLTEDNHPLHIHLGLFKVLDQTELVKPHDEFTECMTKINDAVKCHVDKYARGKKIEVPAHEKGWKNVFKMMPGHVTKVAVRFSYIHTNASYAFDATTEPGYVYHCHVLDHEDNAMMRPLKIIK